MQRLWLANIPPEASDDDLRALVAKYGPDVQCTTIERAPGSGERPAAFMSFSGKKIESLGKLALRLDGMYWKGRKLSCSTTVM
jgi:hypothetical protein